MLPVHAASTGEPPLDESYKDMIELLRFLLSIIGSLPESEPQTLEGWFALIEDAYAGNGVPPMNPIEQLNARSLILDIHTTMQLLRPRINPQAFDEFHAVLVDMYTDLGGNPGDLG